MLLVAVSGGIDSMCLAQKVRLEGGPFAMAHCNFSLRGEESDADEAFVRSWASAYNIPLHVKRFDTQAFAQAEGISVEMAARRLRYRWFGELCREHGYGAVAVAHNANDNAETLLLNLLRGTGLKGITGMKASGFLPDPEYGDIPLLRPLLGMTREEIEAFAREQGLTWREDSTNALNDYKRNKIRNQVFPLFREINPSFVQTLNRDMERFTQELSSEETKVSKPLPLMRPRVATGLDTLVSSEDYVVNEEEWDGTKEVKQPAGVLILDKKKAGEVVEGRWETGDWIRPLGAPGKKKMQDWFTDHHVPADEKPFVPLLKSAQDPHHVLAVIPWCIDHSVRVTKSTRQILRISIKNV
ncbi:MAG: tRNA lysidine(34) synthetase TilS [Bacteroidales bacterium]|nr:tRNA lysidine(34) synthetase TilS [Bacteroidales bacterium]